MSDPSYREVMIRLALLCSCLALGVPCIWDKDTLGDEIRGLPGAFDLVTGRWFRHGDKYYELRIARIPPHLEARQDDLAAYDDLAVAHEYLGDHASAIKVMKRKAVALAEHADKEQQYRYHANLGTFLAHSGRFEPAIQELEKAIAINKEAHFGRERLQIDLIRYVAAARKDETLWTKHNFLTYSNYQLEKLYWGEFIAKRSFTDRATRQKDRSKHQWVTFDRAYTAVAGMLRFGGLEGPELYRTLGDLFLVRRDLHLAWWSYGRAIERGHPAKARLGVARASIEKHWREARKAVGGVGPVPDAKEFAAVRIEAKAWRAAFVAAEDKALRRGADTSAPMVLAGLKKRADVAVPRRMSPARSPAAGRPSEDQDSPRLQKSKGR